MATIDEIVKNYEPNLGGQVLFTIPAPDGGPGNTIDVNTLSEPAVDQLIQQYGGHGPLIGRKNYLQAKRQQQESANPVKSPFDQYYSQAQERATGLQNKLDEIFGQQAEYGTQLIDQAYAPERSKAVSEEAALGRLRSPVSLSAGAPIDRADIARRNAKTQLFSSLAGNRANAQTDIAKTIEQIFGNQQALGLSNDQFTKNYDLGKNQFQANVNNQAANRAQQSDLARAQMQHNTDMNTPSDWDRVTGQISGGLDLFSKIFPMQVPGGSGGSVTQGKKKASSDPFASPEALSMIFA